MPNEQVFDGRMSPVSIMSLTALAKSSPETTINNVSSKYSNHWVESC